jgi:hypothetical protein
VKGRLNKLSKNVKMTSHVNNDFPCKYLFPTQVEGRLRRLNKLSKIMKCSQADVPLQEVFGLA